MELAFGGGEYLSLTGGQLDPTGGNNATLYTTTNAGSSVYHRTFEFVEFTIGQTYKISGYAKGHGCPILLVTTGGYAPSVSFDLTNGTVYGHDGTYSGINITPASNGYYYIEVVWTAGDTGFYQQIQLLNSSFANLWNGDGTSGAYLYDWNIDTVVIETVPVTDGLIADWDMYGGNGQTITNSSGNNFTGELGSTTGSDTNDPTWGSLGLTFDGSNDYVTLDPTKMPNGNVSFTAHVVCKPTALADQIAIAWGEANYLQIPYIWLRANGNISTEMGGALTSTITSAYAANEPVILTIRGNSVAQSLSCIKNNFELSSTGSGVGPFNIHTLSARIGSYVNDSNYFHGDMYEVVVYNRAITDAELAQNYNYLQSKWSDRGLSIGTPPVTPSFYSYVIIQ